MQTVREKLIQDRMSEKINKHSALLKYGIRSNEYQQPWRWKTKKNHIQYDTHNKKVSAKTPYKVNYRQLCNKCGKKHEQNKRPAEEKTWAKCKKMRHFARVCKSKFQKKKVHLWGWKRREYPQWLTVFWLETWYNMAKNKWYEDVQTIKDLQRLEIKTN